MAEPTTKPTLIMCSVYDSKVGVYFQPFFARSRAEAIRSFADAANQNGHIFNKHPGDFSLFASATWCEETNSTENLLAPDNLGTALEHLSRTDDPLQADLA